MGGLIEMRGGLIEMRWVERERWDDRVGLSVLESPGGGWDGRMSWWWRG